MLAGRKLKQNNRFNSHMYNEIYYSLIYRFCLSLDQFRFELLLLLLLVRVNVRRY